jgi:DNA-binding response OmpR family regulator
LIVEDNETTARTLRVFLEAQDYEITCAANGRLGEELFWKSKFDLLILDLMLPDADGISICKSIRSESVVPIVMLTAKTAEDHIVEGLEAGADDYVCKPFGSKELLARIRRCLHRRSDREDESDVLALGEIRLDSEARAVAVDSNPVRLTKSEFNILHLLMKNPGRVFTRTQLIELALGADFDGFDRTIDTHIWSLRKKLGEPRGRPRYIRSELGVGYRMSDDDAP